MINQGSRGPGSEESRYLKTIRVFLGNKNYLNPGTLESSNPRTLLVVKE